MAPCIYRLCDWEDVPADRGWLNTAERQYLDTLRFDKRRRDWLLGRWTVKQAHASLGTIGPGDFARLAVLPDDDGAPVVMLDGAPLDVSLSLSHSNGRGLCVVSVERVALGCDIERIEPRGEGFAETWFTDGECDLLASTPPRDVDRLVTVVWSIKESALKALRTGLKADTRSVEVQFGVAERSPGQGFQRASVTTTDGQQLGGCFRDEDGYVLSVVAPVAFGLCPALEAGRAA